MSALLTKEIAQEAFRLARPSIEAFLQSPRSGDGERKGIHIVMLDPDDGSILHEESFGDADWAKAGGFEQLARDKATQAYRDGVSGDRVKYITPWRFRKGDVRYAGAAYEDGLCIATSGLADHLDSGPSWTVFNWAAILSTDERVRFEKEHPGDRRFR